MTQRSCGTCRFSNPIESRKLSLDQANHVECRFNAPVLAAPGGTTGVWPRVARTEWCGQHEPEQTETRSAA